MRMALLFLLFLVVLTLVLASTNRYCRTGSETGALDPGSIGPQEGNMNHFKFGIAQPWPPISIPKKGRIRLLRYCFATAKAKAELDCPLQKGFKIWADAIKTPASAANGHCLGWMEIHDGNEDRNERMYPTCYLDDYKDKKEPGTWNPIVSADALAIHLGVETEAPYASIGYDHRKTNPGRHYIVMGSKSTEPHRVAHEIGHVLGMAHEHCRFDRDENVLFRCDKLVGYKDALIAASVAGHQDAAERLCTEQGFANEFNFEAGAQYIKNAAFNSIYAPIMDEGPFDLGSIMIYPSNAYAADSNCWEKNDISVCPLVAARFGSTWAIQVNTAPSVGDVNFVRAWYPWLEEQKEPGDEKPKEPGGEKPKEPGGEKPKEPGGEKPKEPGGEKPTTGSGAVVVGKRGGDEAERELVRVHRLGV